MFGWKKFSTERLSGKYIKFFEINVTKVEAKFKFNQNKSDEDILSVIKSLHENNQIDAANFMKKVNT